LPPGSAEPQLGPLPFFPENAGVPFAGGAEFWSHVAIFVCLTDKLFAFEEAGRVGVASTQTEAAAWVMGDVRKAGN